MKTVLTLALFVIAVAGICCDDNSTPSVPPNVQEAATKAQMEEKKGPARPTTQELVTGPKKLQPLTPLPFTVRVPVQWKIELLSGGGIVVLTGPTPSGEAQIQLSTRSTIKKDELEIQQRAAKKEMTQPVTDSPKKTIKAEFRRMGEVEVFERQAIGKPGPMTVIDAKGNEHTETATSYDWTVAMFVPQGNDYARYELNFVALTAEQYQQDKPLLDQIIGSLTYDATIAPPPPPPEAAPAPAAVPAPGIAPRPTAPRGAATHSAKSPKPLP